MLGGSLITTACARPQVVNGGDGLQISRVAVNALNADRRQGVVLQLGGWAWDYQFLAVKNKLVTKRHKGHRTGRILRI
jgi:hypothetical protein